jgi:hypothetical protein
MPIQYDPGNCRQSSTMLEPWVSVDWIAEHLGVRVRYISGLIVKDCLHTGLDGIAPMRTHKKSTSGCYFESNP